MSPLRTRSLYDESVEPIRFVATMALVPLDPDDLKSDEPDAPVTLTGVSVSGRDREQILEALKLNRNMLHQPQPEVHVDEQAVREAIDGLLDQLNDLSTDSTES